MARNLWEEEWQPGPIHVNSTGAGPVVDALVYVVEEAVGLMTR